MPTGRNIRCDAVRESLRILPSIWQDPKSGDQSRLLEYIERRSDEIEKGASCSHVMQCIEDSRCNIDLLNPI